ncbi:SpoIIE family protein phosphatase [Actinotalea sp. AC32]|nr:SpoIIE family protein phosphatase [Actinotalea sp. AC32]
MSAHTPVGLPADAVEVVTALAVDAAGIGAFEWDLATGQLSWDARTIELFGYTPETWTRSIEGFTERLHPDDVGPTMSAIQRAIDSCGEYTLEYRVLLPTGGTRWVAARGRALPGDDGATAKLVGAAYDTTATHEAEARVARVLESIPTAFFSLDRRWRFTYVNAEAERILASPRDRLLGNEVWELFPAAIGTAFERHYREAMESGRTVAFEEYYPAPLDRWYEVRAWPSPDGLSVYFLDISDRRAAQDRVTQAARRAALTARVTAELAEALETEEAVARLAQLVVPDLADWCVVTVVEDSSNGGHGHLRDIASWHVDEERRADVAEYASRRLGSLADDAFLTRALTSSELILVPTDATAAVQRVLLPGRARDLLEVLRPGSAAVLPMRARGRTVGALSLFSGPQRAPMTPAEVTTAEEVAGRAALALDNARLYRQQRTIAEGFQRSLLTDPPQPDHLEIAVRYHPAAEAAQVGGDWYDAFMQPDGATVLVIGDVAGHDIAAAATMSQVRSVLRGIAVTTEAPPAALLERVDRALRTLDTGAIATAVVARLEQEEDELHRGVTRIRWSNAGHPDPMLVAADGTVTPLSAGKPEPLLGLLPDTARTDVELTLDRGATLVLYTDGLVERRDQPLREGMVRLRETLAELAELPLEELCDELLARMVPESPPDDVALVAIRLHPQDVPRPPEAGPTDVPPDVPEDPAGT